MTRISDESKEKFRRVKLNLDAIKKADLEDLDRYVLMIINTVIMMVEIMEEMIDGTKH